MEEKFIPGFNCIYVAKEEGTIYSIERYEKYGQFLRKRKKTIIKQRENCRGYMVCALYKNGKSKNRFVHRMVLSAFIDKPNGKYFVNHKDGNKQNNHISNLEWVTCKQNTRHAYENGLMNPPKGSKHWNSRFSEEHIVCIRWIKILTGTPYSKIAEIFKCDPETIRYICTNRTWKHVK